MSGEDRSRIAHDGKGLYGSRVGILMLETRFPRIPGDMGNGTTWPFPVLYKVVPGATSSLMQIPFIERILPPGKRVGVLTVSAASLTPEHMIAAGADPNTPVVGTENGREFTRVMLDEKHTLDAAAAERDILDAGETLVSRHPDTGAVVLECTNMVPFARALSDHLLLPVFSIYTFVTWFQAGLAPRDFGPPGSAPREWRER